MLAESEILVGLAEIAVVFAGFAGISVVLGRRDPESWKLIDSLRLSGMIQSSLGCAFLALLPIALAGFHVGTSAIWSWSSAAVAVFILATYGRLSFRTRRAYQDEVEDRVPMPTRIIMRTVSVVVAIVLVLNAVGLGFDRSFGPYFLGLLAILGLAGFLFARSLSGLRARVRRPDLER